MVCCFCFRTPERFFPLLFLTCLSFRNRRLAYQSIGVIYGDIGTSPLYVFSSTFTSEPSPVDVLGVLSIVLWSITLVVTVKYVLIVLLADNEGEGGTFSCYSLLTRYVSAKFPAAVELRESYSQPITDTSGGVFCVTG